MIMDTSLEFAKGVSVAAGAGTTLIGTQLDLALANQTTNYETLYLVVIVSTGIITGGSAGTLSLKLASDTTAAISTTTSTVHLQTGAFVTGATAIPAGAYLYVGGIPAGMLNSSGNDFRYKRFLGILAIVGTTTITAGAISAFLTLDPPAWVPYAAAI